MTVLSRGATARLIVAFSAFTKYGPQKRFSTRCPPLRSARRLAPELYTYEDDIDPSPSHTTEIYLSLLHTYLLALAIAGSNKVPGAPSEGAFGSDPTAFVGAPWDVLEAYYFRATRTALAIPEASRAAWLERVDVAERAVWVSQFRDGDRTMGQEIQTIMHKR